MFFVQELSSAEEDRELHFVSFLQEFTCAVDFDIKVVFVGFGSKPNFFQGRMMNRMFFMRIANLAFLAIQPLAIIHYSTDRRDACRCNLDKVQPGFICPVERLACIYHPDLIVFFIYQPNCPDPNFSVYP